MSPLPAGVFRGPDNPMLFVAGFRDRAEKMEGKGLRSVIRKIPRFGEK